MKETPPHSLLLQFFLFSQDPGSALGILNKGSTGVYLFCAPLGGTVGHSAEHKELEHIAAVHCRWREQRRCIQTVFYSQSTFASLLKNILLRVEDLQSFPLLSSYQTKGQPYPLAACLTATAKIHNNSFIVPVFFHLHSSFPLLLVGNHFLSVLLV